MSDFFHHLAARTLSPSNSLQPRISSLFEPLAADDKAAPRAQTSASTGVIADFSEQAATKNILNPNLNAPASELRSVPRRGENPVPVSVSKQPAEGLATLMRPQSVSKPGLAVTKTEVEPSIPAPDSEGLNRSSITKSEAKSDAALEGVVQDNRPTALVIKNLTIPPRGELPTESKPPIVRPAERFPVDLVSAASRLLPEKSEVRTRHQPQTKFIEGHARNTSAPRSESGKGHQESIIRVQVAPLRDPVQAQPNLVSAHAIIPPSNTAGRKTNQSGVIAESKSTDTTPTINITIGRVEVRAVTTEKARSVQKKEPSHALSLEKYLENRSRGGRG